jgi:hypothetical protein
MSVAGNIATPPRGGKRAPGAQSTSFPSIAGPSGGMVPAEMKGRSEGKRRPSEAKKPPAPPGGPCRRVLAETIG